MDRPGHFLVLINVRIFPAPSSESGRVCGCKSPGNSSAFALCWQHTPARAALIKPTLHSVMVIYLFIYLAESWREINNGGGSKNKYIKVKQTKNHKRGRCVFLKPTLSTSLRLTPTSACTLHDLCLGWMCLCL